MGIRFGKLRVEINESVLHAFELLKNAGVVICVNHCRHEDPYILFGVSRAVKECFYFLTAREIFGSKDAYKAQWLQKLGCFSVARATLDVASFRAARQLLMQQKKVVIFPEGEISHQNNSLMELKNGAIHIALSAAALSQSKSESKRDRDSKEGQIYIVPLVLKYRYEGSVEAELQQSLERLERYLGSSVDLVGNGSLKASGLSFEQRLRQLFELLMSRLQEPEKMLDEGLSFDHKMWLVREKLLEEARAHLGVELLSGADQLSRMHILRGMFNEAKRDKNKGGKSYSQCEKYKRYDFKKARPFYHRLKIAIELCGIGEQSINRTLREEEKAELVSILEKIVFGKVTMKRPDFVRVEAGIVLDMECYLPDFKQDKKKAIAQLKAKLVAELQDLLLNESGTCNTSKA